MGYTHIYSYLPTYIQPPVFHLSISAPIHSFIHSADVTGVLLDVKKFSNLEEYIMNKPDESFSFVEFIV